MSDLLFAMLLGAAQMPAWVGIVLTIAPMLFLAVLAGWSLGGRHTRRRESVERLTDALPWLAEAPVPVEASGPSEVPSRRRHRWPLATWEPQPDMAPSVVLDQVPTVVIPRVEDAVTTVPIRGAR